MAEGDRQGSETTGGTLPGEGSGTGPLDSGRGTTAIDDAVVTKVAGIAAREVRGVFELGGGAARAFGNVTQRVGIGDDRTQGVSVEVGETEAAIDLTVVVEYGESIPQVAEQIRDNVVTRVEGITGLSVTEVNVAVNDLHFPGDDRPQQPDEPPRVA
ncbi:MAG: Asp23/Gls24 family envelope stress response protein [Thermoleophilaceae bacterium]